METQLTQNARDILEKRYLRMINGRRETIEEWITRIVNGVAQGIASLKKEDSAQVYATVEDFKRILSLLRFIPNTPCLMNAGTPLGQLAACFVLPIEDDMGSATSGIFATLRNAALIQQTGGGVGFDWSQLRPEGDLVASSGGCASGPISFLRIYDAAFGGIAQGGSRRGANMAVLRVDHPDIGRFIACKRASEKTLTNFNISVALTDAFMTAVETDAPFNLINPRTHAIAKTVRAREIMTQIAENAHANGEPGVLFIDKINRENPVPHCYTIAATNPCGEVSLGPYENCCLGHINLARHCDSHGVIDWSVLEYTTRTAVAFLDSIVSANKYVAAVPQLREAALLTRRIGLGITGLADVFMRAGIAYGSEESAVFAERIISHIRYWAMDASANLAKLIAPFPAIAGSIWDPTHVEATIARLKVQYEQLCTHYEEMPDQVIPWDNLMDKIKTNGIRNACIMAIAPTGTTSIILGVDGYGCEPVFSLSYSRTTGDGKRMNFCNDTARHLIEEHCPDKDLAARIIQHIATKGCIPADVTRTGTFGRYVRAIEATALNITPRDHLFIQEVLQHWVDNSISKTVNCPNDTSVANVQDIYMSAWKRGLKGVALYRTNSRQTEVLVAVAGPAPSVAGTSAPAVVDASSRSEPKKKRPSLVSGCTYKCETSFGHVFTTMNFGTSQGGFKDPFEVFVTVGKSGTEARADCEAIGRLISFILRMNASVSTQERLSIVIEQLRNIGGSRDHRDSASKRLIRSIPDAVAIALEEINRAIATQDVPCGRAPPETSVPGDTAERVLPGRDICPACHKMTLVRTERCAHCEDCPYSAC